MKADQPTPYPEVNKVLNALLPEIKNILGNQFVGMYLFGSLAYGGFDRASDVDFLVITEEVLPEPLFNALNAMHMRIKQLDSWSASQLEGIYAPRLAMRIFDPVNILHIHIDRGEEEQLKRMEIHEASLSRAWWGGWVFLRAVLWEHGITLAGPQIRTLVEPVKPGELRQAALANFAGWLEPLLYEVGELAIPGYQPYCVLTLCRLLYTLEKDAITTKGAAARWAQSRLEERWRILIDQALTNRQADPRQASAQAIEETRAFIRYTLAEGQRIGEKRENE